MNPHRIIKRFHGSQHGNDFNVFEAGTVADLSPDLAAIAVKEGWAELAEPASAATPKPDPVIQPDSIVHGPADREMKVVEVQETKPEKPKKGKKAA